MTTAISEKNEKPEKWALEHLGNCLFLYWFVRANNQVRQTGQFKQPKFIVSQFWGLAVQDQGINRVGSFGELWGKTLFQASALCLQMATFSLCLLMVFLCVPVT